MSTALARRADPALIEKHDPVALLATVERTVLDSDDPAEAKWGWDVADLIRLRLRKIWRAAATERRIAIAMRYAAAVKFIAMRRVGQLLRDMEERGERATGRERLRRGPGSDRKIPGAVPTPRTLADLGLERNQAQYCRDLALIPDGVFQHRLRDPEELTQASLLRLAKQYRPEPVHEVIARQAKAIGVEIGPDPDTWNPDRTIDSFMEWLLRWAYSLSPAQLETVATKTDALAIKFPVALHAAADQFRRAAAAARSADTVRETEEGQS